VVSTDIFPDRLRQRFSLSANHSFILPLDHHASQIFRAGVTNRQAAFASEFGLIPPEVWPQS